MFRMVRFRRDKEAAYQAEQTKRLAPSQRWMVLAAGASYGLADLWLGVAAGDSTGIPVLGLTTAGAPTGLPGVPAIGPTPEPAAPGIA